MKAPASMPSPTSPLLAALRERRGGFALTADVPGPIWWRALVGPAGDFLARPGKEVRARACTLGWRLAGGAGDPPDALALAVEALHAGSLIVDDVEDDSLERRGAPALHRLVGTPLAINTGNWMYFWALALLDEAGLDARRHRHALGAAIRTLMACHQGQALDLAVRIGDLGAGDVPAVVAATTRLKTGALMGLATRLGAVAAGADDRVEHEIASLGEAIGVGLQMLDDLGSIACESRADKGREDLRAGRPTWPWAWLAGSADELVWGRLSARVRALGADASEAEIDGLAGTLCREVESHGRQVIREHLDGALAAAAGLGGHARPALDQLRAELAHMEASYG